MDKLTLYREAAEYHGANALCAATGGKANLAGFHATLAAHFAGLFMSEEFERSIEFIERLLDGQTSSTRTR